MCISICAFRKYLFKELILMSVVGSLYLESRLEYHLCRAQTSTVDQDWLHWQRISLLFHWSLKMSVVHTTSKVSFLNIYVVLHLNAYLMYSIINLRCYCIRNSTCFEMCLVGKQNEGYITIYVFLQRGRRVRVNEAHAN